MKKLRLFCSLALICMLTLSLPQPVYANMAAPEEPDIGSAITFEKNEDIAVRSEVLYIDVDGGVAHISAAYTMENTAAEAVSTPAMFLSPNMSGGSVTVNGTDIPFTSSSYALSGSTKVTTEDWQYAVLPIQNAYSERTVDTVTFTLDFAPRATCDVAVSYIYQLGGWPDLANPGSREGEIQYYLTPAAMWKDFENLTINLHLDRNLPNITESSLPFEKVGRRTYQYVRDTLPEADLHIKLGPNRLLRTFGSMHVLMIFLPLLFPIIIILLAVILFRIANKKPKK